MKRCFLCHRKIDEKTGLCTNEKCVRSKPLGEKKETKETETTENKDS